MEEISLRQYAFDTKCILKLVLQIVKNSEQNKREAGEGGAFVKNAKPEF